MSMELGPEILKAYEDRLKAIDALVWGTFKAGQNSNAPEQQTTYGDIAAESSRALRLVETEDISEDISSWQAGHLARPSNELQARVDSHAEKAA